MKRGGGLHPARPDFWPPTKRPRASPGGLIAASVTCLSRREGGPPCLRTSPPLGGTLGVHRTSWRIPFPRHACMFLVLGFRGAWVRTLRLESQSSAGLRMQPYPRAPDLVWPGHLHGTGCLSARAVGTGFPTVGLRLWLGPGCVWWWVLFTPACCGWGLGWVCLGSVCGVVPLLPAVCGVRGWALVSACFRDLCGFVCVSLALRCFRFRCAVWACVLGPGLGCAPPFLAGLSGCVFCAFFFFRLLGVPVPGLVVSPPVSFLSGWAAGFFFFFFLSACFGAPFPAGPLFLAWCRRFWLGGPPVPVWGSCLRCPLGGGFGPLLCCWRRFGGCGLFSRAHPPLFFFFGGGGGGAPGCSSLCLSSAGACSVAGVWCGWSLATPGGGSCVLLPATPGWVSLPVVVGGPRHSWLGSAGGGGVWRWCVGGVVAGVWCGWSLATPGGGSCVLLPATPGWVSLPLVVGGPRHSWLGSACGGGVWCVVCGGGVLVGLWLVCGVVGPSPLLAEVPVCYSPPLLAGFRCRWWWAVPATPGWGPLAAVVCGVWCAVCGVWCVAVVCWWGCSGVWCGWSLATPGGGSCVLLPATPGWVSLPPLVGGPRHSWLGSACGGGVWCVVCGGGVLVGLWLVCGVVGPSPLLAEVPVCYSPPLLAGFRCRWWWAVPATPGWGPLAASVCGVWRWCVVGVVVGVWCGWSLATPGGGPCVLLPATPGWVSLPVVVGGPRHSWLGSAGGGGVWCVVWCVVCCWGSSPLLAEVPVCYSPPLLAGFRCRWWWAVPATPGWGPLAAVVCVLCLAGSGGPASRARSGAPHPFLWPLCLSALLGPLRAGVAPLSFAAVAVPRWLFFSASRCLARASFVSPAWPLAALWWLLPRPPPPLCLAVFVAPACGLCVFFFFLPLLLPPCAPVVSGFLWFPAPGALGLGACVVCFVGLPLLGSPCACPSFVLSAWLLAAPAWLLPPPPLVSRGFRSCRSVLCAVLCCACLGAVLRRAAACSVARCCAVVCCVALAWCRCLLRRALWRCPSPWGPVLCGAVFCGVPPRCVLCAVCVLSWCGGACCCSPLCLVLCVSRGAVLCVPCALRSVRCCASLCWCARVVLLCGACCCWRLVLWCAAVCCAVSCGVPRCGAGSGGPWLSAGGVFRCRCPCLAAWSASLWLVWFAVVPCFPVLCSVVLCCRVVLCCCALLSCCGAVGACFALLWAVVLCCVVLLVGCAVFGPVVVSACCGALFLALCVPCLLRSVRCGALLCWLWCPASLCRVLWRCAVVWCCAVVLCCRFAVLFVFALPSCGLSCGARVVCAVVGASCCGVSLCVVVSPWAFCGVVVLLWCVVVSCCAVRCPVVSCALCRVLRCRAVLRCCAGWLCCAVVCAAGVCFVLFSFAKNPCRFSVPFKTLFFFF